MTRRGPARLFTNVQLASCFPGGFVQACLSLVATSVETAVDSLFDESAAACFTVRWRGHKYITASLVNLPSTTITPVYPEAGSSHTSTAQMHTAS